MDVTLPNGKVIKGVPEGTPKDEVARAAIRNGLAKPADFGMSEQTWEIPGMTSAEQAQQSRVTPDTPRVQPRTWVDDAMEGAAAVPIMAGVVRGGQLLSKGAKAAPYIDDLARMVMPKSGGDLLFQGALGAGAGAAAGAADRATPEDSPFKPVVGPIVGMAAAAPFAMAQNANLLARGGRGGMQQALEVGGDTADVLGKARAAQMASTAIKANPNLVPSVIRATEIEKQTGVTLPTLAAANGDTTISSYIQSQTSRGDNALFTAQLKQQYEAAEAALTKAKRGVAPSMQEVDTYVKRKATELAVQNQETAAKAAALAEKRAKGVESIDNRIQQISSGIVGQEGRESTGKALTNLLNAKESAIRTELSPQYDKLLKDSSAAGITLPAQAAQQLRGFAIDETNKDVFAKFPGLYGTINKVFRPQQAPVSGKFAEKYPQLVAARPGTAKDIPLEQLDSLKREVNKALRDTSDKDQIRKLVLLKKEVDNAIDATDPAFSVPYRSIDREYATRLGLPFSEQGVVNINRAKFVEDTIPQLTKNASSLKQTLAIVGDDPQGMKIIEDAFLFDIGNNRSIINADGVVNPAQLKRYMAQNKEKIDLVPGLKEKLEQTAGSVENLVKHRTTVLNNMKNAKVEQAENLYSQAYGTSGGLRGVVRRGLTNAAELDKLMAVVDKDPVAKAGVKSALLDDLLTAQGDTVALFNSNRPAIEKIYGKQGADQVLALVEASQRLRDNPFTLRLNINTLGKTGFEQATGSKIEQTAGEMRNQILSAPRVLLNHISRYFQNRSTQAESAEVQHFLSNPKNLQLAAEYAAEVSDKGLTEKAKEIGTRLIKNSGSTYLYGGATGALMSYRNEEGDSAQGYTPSDPSMLEGFGQQ